MVFEIILAIVAVIALFVLCCLSVACRRGREHMMDNSDRLREPSEKLKKGEKNEVS